jgi:tetratricopeptide (TPR) repeat protein
MRPSALNICAPLAAIALSIASINPPCAYAQTPAAATAAAAAKSPDYSAESIVIEHADSIYTFAADGTGTQERGVTARVQSDAAVRALGVVSVAFAADSQRVEFVYARVRHPDGSVVETPAADAIDMPEQVTREAPLYSDLKEKQLPIRALRTGDTLEWRARITTFKPQAPGQIWGQENFVDDAVVLDEVIELRVPAGTSINVWSPTAKPVESDLAASGSTPARHVYRWTSSHLTPTAGKEAEAAAEAKKKTVWTAEQELDADQGKLPTIAWTTFKSWEEVGAWYRGLQADRVAPSPEIKAKAAELIAGKSTDEEKVRALYAYVATQIRYIGVDFGIGRYQPHTAAEILANQYGDCKDKHTLLAAMLKAAGIQSDAVLIGAGIRFNEAVPSPASFNHVITHLTVNSAAQPTQQIWLDTTAEISPYRMLLSVIRDHQALIVPAATAPYIAKTPADPPFPSFQNMDATGAINKEGTSQSRLTLTVRGDLELILRGAFHQTAPAQYGQLVQRIVNGMGYAGTTSNPEVSRPEDTADPFKMSFDYERIKAGDWDNYKIVPQVAPADLPRFSDTDPLVRSLDLGYPHTETSHAAMKIPDGWTAILPEAAHWKSAWATYDETYRFEKGTVYTERRIEVLKQKVPTADLKAYKKWANDADLGDELFIQLVRHDADTTTTTVASATAPAAAATPAAPSDAAPSAQAQKLIEQAYQDIIKVDLYNAKDLLDQAQKLSPNHEYLWMEYGALHFRNGEMADALADYKKELALHPAAFQRTYPAIIQTQLLLGERNDAKDSLRAWIKADPVDPDPVAQLLNMLVEDNETKAAISEGEAALTHLPADGDIQNVQIALGHAYLMADNKPKGSALLRTVLQNTDDAGILNDAAYILSDAGLELPLSESSTRTALTKLSDESNSWTLDEDPGTLYKQSRLISATWDTLGWILYREGKLDEALNYLQPAWLDQPRLETGQHVGEVLTARGDRAGALATYQMAIATVRGYNDLGVSTAPTAQEKQVQALADALPPPAKNAKPARERLLELRTIPLGPANGRAANAEYRILVRDGKAVRTLALGDKTVPGAEDMISKASFASRFPTGVHTTLVAMGYVNCHAKVCELVLEP